MEENNKNFENQEPEENLENQETQEIFEQEKPETKQEKPAEPKAKKPFPKRAILIGAIAAFVIVAAVVGVLLWPKGTDPVHQHTVVTDAAKAPTCTETGLTAGSHCGTCGEVLEQQTVIPATGHTYTTAVTAPTCTEAGYTTYTCACGDTYTADAVAALGHTGGMATCQAPAVCERCGTAYGEIGHDWAEATCTAPKTCTICATTEGDALGHTGGTATCTAKAVCERCNNAYGVSADHSFTEQKTDAIYRETAGSCETNAVYHYSCACGERGNETFEVPASGHNYKYMVAANGQHVKYCANETDATGGTLEDCSGGTATCTEGAVCAFCGEHYTDELGHSWDDGTTQDATCVADGKTVYTCENGCGATKETAIPATGHNWVGESTCEAGRECSVCGATDVTLPHNYIETVTPANCIAAEIHTYTCDACGDSYTDSVGAPNGHDISGVEPTKNVLNDCEYVEVFQCKNCEEKINGDTYSSHTYVASIALAATCQDAGQKLLTCSKCGGTKTEAIDPNATGHKWIEGTAVDGERIDTCEHCGEQKTVTVYAGNATSATNASNFKDKEIQLDNASLKLDDGVLNTIGDKTVTVSANIATEDDLADLNIDPEKLAQVGDNKIYNFTINDGSGNIAQFGEENFVTITLPYTLKDGEDVDSIAVWFINDQGELTSIEATYNNGFVTFKTNHFSYYTITNLTPEEKCALYGHDWTESVVKGDCLNDGYIFKLCLCCHVTEKTVTKVADGHNFGKTVVAATCTEDGMETNTCADCGYFYQTKINRLGHTMTETIVAATCESAGYTLHACEVCDYEYTDSLVAALGHSYAFDAATWTWSEDKTTATVTVVCANDEAHTIEAEAKVTVKTVAATCQAEGSVTYTAKFTYNGETYSNVQTKVIDKIVHVEDDFKWMHDDDQHWTICVCGIRTDAADHAFTNSTVTKAPTCTEAGEKTFVCVCGATHKESVAPTGHNYVETSRTEATCVKAGEIVTTCEGCGDEVKTEISATGVHTYVETSKTEATCVKEGAVVNTCRVCGDVQNTVIPATGVHNYTETSRTEATCAADGSIVKTCAGCGDAQTEVIPATGKHVYENGVCSVCGAAENTCDHSELTQVVEWDIEEVAALGFCEGNCLTYKTCECGERKVLDEEHSMLECDFEWTEGEEWESEDGKEYYELEIGVCRDCGFTVRYEMREFDNGDCSYSEKDTYSFYYEDGTVFVENVLYEYTYYNHDTEYVIVDLSQYGACGGYFNGWKCKNCDQITSIDDLNPTCEDYTNEETTYVDEKGFEHDVISALCNTCGLFYKEDTYTETVSVCESIIYLDKSLTIGDTVIFSNHSGERDNNHEYQYEYSDFKGETCEDGYTVNVNCPKCGYSYRYQNRGHSTQYNEIDLTEYGFCGGRIEERSCRICKVVLGTYVYNDYACRWQYQASGEVDKTPEVGKMTAYYDAVLSPEGSVTVTPGVNVGGNTVVVVPGGNGSATDKPVIIVPVPNPGAGSVATCAVCGGEKRTATETIPDEGGCGYTEKKTLAYSMNGETVYESVAENHYETHDYEYTYTMEGETCEDGVIATGTCKACGDVSTSHYGDHITEQVAVNLSDFGFCEGTYYKDVCKACGENTSYYGSYVTCEFEFQGSVDGVTTEVCKICGAEKRTWEEKTEKDEDCYLTYTSYCQYLSNGEVVIDFKNTRFNDEHDYELQVQLNGATCEDGGVVIYTCKDCDSSYYNTIYSHSTIYTQENLYDLGLCGGQIGKHTCTFCNEVTSINVDASYCDWHYQETTADGVEIYTCSKCKAEKHTWTTVFDKDANCRIKTEHHVKFVVGEEVVFEGAGVSFKEEHNYEYKPQMNGDTCEDGGIIYATCTDCGDTFVDKFDKHYCENIHIDFGAFGMCGGYASQDVCRVCGEVVGSYINDYSCWWQYHESEDGEGYYKCENCGVEKHVTRVEATEKNENCLWLTEVRCTYVKDGETVFETFYIESRPDHDFEQQIIMLGKTCEDGVEIISTCKTCGGTERFKDNWHDVYTERIEFAEFGFCGGYTYEYRCTRCDFIGTRGVETYPCKWRTVEQTENGEIQRCNNCNGERHIITVALEKDEYCQTKFEITYTYIKDGEEKATFSCIEYKTEHDYETHIEMNGDTCEDGGKIITTCKSCGDFYEEEFWDHSTERVDTYLGDFGMCGGYVYEYVCTICKSVVESSVDDHQNCYWEYRDHKDGVDISFCYGCNTERHMKNEVSEKDENCNVQYKNSWIYYRDGEEVYRHVQEDQYQSHYYEPKYEMMGSTCDEGVSVTYTCKDCKHSYTEQTWEHNVEFFETPLDSEDICYGYLSAEICTVCEQVLYSYLKTDCWYPDYTIDENGVRVEICEYCGVEKHSWDEYSEKDENCNLTRYYRSQYYLNGELLFETVESHYETHHNYEETIEGDCETGGRVYRECKDCGMTDWYKFKNHLTERVEIDLKKFGLCGGRIYNDVCTICGIITYSWTEDYSCGWQEQTGTEEGVTVWVCATCGAEKHCSKEQSEKDENCVYVISEITAYYKDGKEVCRNVVETRKTEHDFEKSYEPNGDTCESNGKIYNVCKICGKKEFDRYFYGHQTTPTYTQLSEYGMCDGYITTFTCDICDTVTWSGINEEHCDWIKGDVNEEGFTVDTCKVCSTVRYTKSEVGEKDDKCNFEIVDTYIYYRDGEKILNYVKRKQEVAHDLKAEIIFSNGTCEFGGVTTYTCAVCEYSYQEHFSGHKPNENQINLSDSGMCGGYAYENVCSRCNKVTSRGVYDYACKWLTQESEDGVQVAVCDGCGAERRIWETVEKDEACNTTRTIYHAYILNEKELFSYSEATVWQEHDYKETIKKMGETCKDGFTITRTCKNCGESFSDQYWEHYIQPYTVNMGELGLCEGNFIHVDICIACKEQFGGHNNDGCCAWEYQESTEEGVEVAICTICNAEKRIWYSEEQDENGKYTSARNYAYFVNGEQVYLYVERMY